MVAGALAEQISAEQKAPVVLDLVVEKTWWPSAKISGSASSDEVNALLDLTFSSAKYTAKRENAGGLFKGVVDKTKWDWDVAQTGQTEYEIDRVGSGGWSGRDPKLALTLKDGKITGNWTYRNRKELIGHNWEITGTYDSKGQVKLNIDTTALFFDLSIVGTIKP